MNARSISNRASSHLLRITDSSRRMLPYWLAGALTAAVSVVYAKAFGWSEKLAFSWVEEHPALGFLIVPSAMLLSSLMVHFLSAYAGGSGIPQLLAAIEVSDKPNPLVDKILNLRMLAVKFVGSCISVAGGGVTGREGPTLQISASVFYNVQKLWTRLNLKFTPDLQSMILAGGAAGLASAFNTPLGGIIFAIEELAKVHISTIRTYTFHAVIIAGFLTQAILGNYLYFGKFEIGAQSAYELMPLVLAAGCIGLLGGFLGWSIVKVADWRTQSSLQTRLTLTVVCGLGVATLIYLFGKSASGSGREVIIDLLIHAQTPAEFQLGFVRGLANFLTYSGGVVGGVFAPALSTGAGLGSWMSGFLTDSNHQVWVLMGMVAFLTGLTRAPFTSLILVLEMTDTHNVILVLMVSAIIAQSAAKIIDPVSFYEHVSFRIIHGKPPGAHDLETKHAEAELKEKSHED